VPPHEKGAKRGVQYVLERNFGEFDFDWDKRELVVRIFGKDGTPLVSTAWDLDLLSGKVPAPETGKVKQSDYEQIYEHLSMHGAEPNDWFCVNHRGHTSLALKLFGVASPILLASFIILLPAIVLGSFVIFRRPKIRTKAKQS
jgi:hypothetical protein